MTTTIDTVQSFKILIIGDSNVGKTSLMNRMVHGVFNNNYTSTIGVDFKIATINIGEYKCRLQIWFAKEIFVLFECVFFLSF
jgi:GTPase SAR1 family protein